MTSINRAVQEGGEKPEEIFDRDTEWAELQRLASLGGRRIALVYGRRRQGKSFILAALARSTGGFYHQALEEERQPAIENLSRTIATYADVPAWATPRFDDWPTAFRALAEQTAGRPIVLDEFPYLVRKSPELPSVIQHAYDAAQGGGHPAFCLVLCGSALAVMTGLLTGQQALRGRASLDMLIQPFDFRVSREFWGIADLETAFLVNATLGGPPGYRDLLTGQVPGSPAEFQEWLEAGVLNPSHALFREAEYLLAEDPALADRSLYQTIVGLVATGTSTRGGLANRLGRPSSALEHSLGQLERAGLLFRDEDLLRSNRPLLRVADPLLRFAFAVIRPDRSRFESRLTGEAWADAQPRFRSQVLGPHFESMAREWVRAYASSRTLGGRPRRVGFVKVDLGVEEKGYELDVVVEGAGERVGGRTTVIAIGEAKASHVARTKIDLDRLERLRGRLAMRADVSHAKILLFGRAGFDSDLVSVARGRRDIEFVDLVRMYEGD